MAECRPAGRRLLPPLDTAAREAGDRAPHQHPQNRRPLHRPRPRWSLPRRLPQSQLNVTSSYRALLNGGDWDDTPITSHTFKGNSLRCLSPVHIRGTRDGEGTLTLNWIRRTRWYGEWQDGTDIPLFEEAERYEVDIMEGDSVKRTLSVSSPQAVYSATDQLEDFGSLQPVLKVHVYQLNAVTGRGQGATASL